MRRASMHACWKAAQLQPMARSVPAMHAQFDRRRRPSSRTLRSCGGSAARSRGRLSCATRCCASRCAAPPLLRQQTPFNASGGTANARGYPHAPRLTRATEPKGLPWSVCDCTDRACCLRRFALRMRVACRRGPSRWLASLCMHMCGCALSAAPSVYTRQGFAAFGLNISGHTSVEKAYTKEVPRRLRGCSRLCKHGRRRGNRSARASNG